jgi:parvulin-like peptidyl-prolyl isomerase
MKRLLLLPTVLVASALVLSACSGGATGYAYVFDGQTTTQATVDRELQALTDNKLFAQALQQSSSGVSLTTGNGSISSSVSAAWVNALVQYEAIDRAVQERNVTVTPADRTQAQAQVAQLFGSAQVFSKFPSWFRQRELAREARKVAFVRKTAKAPTEADVQAYYAANAASVCPSGKVVFHILVATQQQAQTIETQLAAGTDFGTLAKQLSTDTQSAAQNGLLGCLQPGQAPAEYDTAVAALTPGQTSAPVHSQYGWSVIKVVAPSYDVLAPSLRAALDQQSAQQVTVQIGRRVKRATLKVNPRYGRIQRSKTGVTIVAPKQPKVRTEPSTTTTTPVQNTPTPSVPQPTG